MQKKIFEGINLTCLFQNENVFDTPAVSSGTSSDDTNVLSGMLSRNQSGDLTFQETLPRRRDIRNSKIYQSDLVSLVRRKDGRYYILLKAFRPDEITDKSSLAQGIYSEIVDALYTIG